MADLDVGGIYLRIYSGDKRYEVVFQDYQRGQCYRAEAEFGPFDTVYWHHGGSINDGATHGVWIFLKVAHIPSSLVSGFQQCHRDFATLLRNNSEARSTYTDLSSTMIGFLDFLQQRGFLAGSGLQLTKEAWDNQSPRNNHGLAPYPGRVVQPAYYKVVE
ncbi:hypothetical protein DACRYDRAFT_116074 [Dacryopinax primogenitus]|uniref:Uncharacterized protein n=1 Tax=Dacryopinax primogenitus (strain DJM 731) TaxID=1858805 RepID=M5G0U2_DACPD|nr:uncharacterized protein DACRYDRAFT_116074 [Dacryopinax primogenitus]EJU02364.1 hypothetical protein DACRYDRAFT_116074 [Dacryopinax primogenitus]